MAEKRTCVIFNPTARGEKARRFRRHLDALGGQITLKLTAAVGDARLLGRDDIHDHAALEHLCQAGLDAECGLVVHAR